MNMVFRLAIYLLGLFFCADLHSQSKSKSTNLVYVDKSGVLRWTKDNKEASFFGVNYTTPFAYSYRAIKALGIEPEEAIRQDVYQLARLGLDAFRVHVWDTEISDSSGNLLENEHLKLFDYLLAELKKRNIKIIITPIAFWGNGYPERDELTPGFSRKYGKGRATVNDTAIAAQENYLRQFFNHVNSYTNLTYRNDPDVIAVELNNEPSHSGPKSGVTAYINRLAAAVRSVGWTKPVFYNIAQGPYYADAVAKANIDGVSFQWYPTGLVANEEVKGNFLPNVDHYTIPFDTIPEYRNKSKMVYEFDAADLLQSCMYPAIARSFREAGFQWVTQFAYDPTALAYANTEYQTHYLNLNYTPSKAISILIAAKAFHSIQRLKGFGNYPADTVFENFRVSYKNSLSEMNDDQEFYYSNSTDTKPVNASKLLHVAGVGSSAIIKYNGTGAYFLDKLADGVWRMEIMPDAIHIRDPFERASPQKEVTRIQWRMNSIEIRLPDLNAGFAVKGLNEGNSFSSQESGNSFEISPGTYLLSATGKNFSPGSATGPIGLKEFGGAKQIKTEVYLRHEPIEEVSAAKPFLIEALVVGVDSADKINVQIYKVGVGFNQSAMIPMSKQISSVYSAEVPVSIVSPGLLNYRIIIKKGNNYHVFPGDHTGDPFAWNNFSSETYQTYVAADSGRLELYEPTKNRDIRTYPQFGRGFQTAYITGTESQKLILKLAATELGDDHTMGFQFYVGDKLKGRSSENFQNLIIRTRTSNNEPLKAKITLINKDAFAFSYSITLNDVFTDLEIPLKNLEPDSMLLLPRPYPGFLPLWFKAVGTSSMNISEIEKIQVTIGTELAPSEFKKPYNLEVYGIWLEK